MRTAEEILISLGYVIGDPELNFVYLEELLKVVQREVLKECVEICHKQGVLGYPEEIEPQLKKLLTQIQ
jgi:hypothetical protein